MSQVAERTGPVSAHVARYLAEYQAAKLPSQPPWLTRTREAALANFERLGFPSTRHEEWRFTPVGPIAEKPFVLAADGMAKADTRLSTRLAADDHLLPPLRRRQSPGR